MIVFHGICVLAAAKYIHPNYVPGDKVQPDGESADTLGQDCI